MNHTTRPKLLRWLQIGKKEGATHMLLVEDGLADETVPVYISPPDRLEQKMLRFKNSHSMQIIAVFDLHIDLERQLDSVCP